jgi:hypothetical protein
MSATTRHAVFTGQLFDRDGYGRYGVLEEQPGGLVCHECGRTFPRLGLHAYRGHGMTAAQYRERHGLQRTAGLITADLRARIQDNARAQMASSAGQAFIQARDPQRAQAARLAQPRPWRTATRATNRAARAGKVAEAPKSRVPIPTAERSSVV